MAKKTEELVVSKQEAEAIRKLLHAQPKSRAECAVGTRTKSYTVPFGNGIEMEITVCGAVYEGTELCRPWTEAVLSRRGYELARTVMPGECFLGKWELDCDGTEYEVTLKGQGERRKICPLHSYRRTKFVPGGQI